MGTGSKKDDSVILGRLKVMPWEREPLTEIQPLRDNAPLPSDSGLRRTGFQGARKNDPGVNTDGTSD